MDRLQQAAQCGHCLCHVSLKMSWIAGTLFVLQSDPSPKQRLLDAVTSKSSNDQQVHNQTSAPPKGYLHATLHCSQGVLGMPVITVRTCRLHVPCLVCHLGAHV